MKPAFARRGLAVHGRRQRWPQFLHAGYALRVADQGGCIWGGVADGHSLWLHGDEDDVLHGFQIGVVPYFVHPPETGICG